MEAAPVTWPGGLEVTWKQIVVLVLLVAAVTSFLSGWLLRSRTELAVSGIARRVLVAHTPVAVIIPLTVLIYLDLNIKHMLIGFPATRWTTLGYGVVLLASFILLTVAWSTGAFEKLIERWLRHREAATQEPSSTPSLHIPAAFGAVLVAAVAGVYIINNVVKPLQPGPGHDLILHINAALELLGGGNPYWGDGPGWTLPAVLPTAGYIYLPLATLSPVNADRLYLLLNHVLFAASAVMLGKALRQSIPWRWWLFTWLLLGAVSVPLSFSLGLGQMDAYLLFLLAVITWSMTAHKPLLAGLAMGLLLVSKPTMLLLLFYFLLTRQLLALLAAGLTAGGMVALSLLWTQPAVWQDYIFHKIPAMLPGSSIFDNISLSAFHYRLFLGRYSGDYWDYLKPEGLAPVFNYVALAFGLAMFAYLVRGNLRSKSAEEQVWDFMCVAAGTLVLFSVAWFHYAVWIIPAIALVASVSSPSLITPAQRLEVLVWLLAGFCLLNIEFGFWNIDEWSLQFPALGHYRNLAAVLLCIGVWRARYLMHVAKASRQTPISGSLQVQGFS